MLFIYMQLHSSEYQFQLHCARNYDVIGSIDNVNIRTQTILLNLGGCEGAHTLICNHIFECPPKTVLVLFNDICKIDFSIYEYVTPIQVIIMILHLISTQYPLGTQHVKISFMTHVITLCIVNLIFRVYLKINVPFKATFENFFKFMDRH